MPSFDLALPSLHFPLIGNTVAVAIPSLLHIVLAGLSVAFMVMAPIFEWRGQRTPHVTDLAYAITKFTVIVFSVSTVLAVIMVELMIGLFPVTTMWIWNQFRAPIALAIGAFFLQFAALYPYYHYWERIRRRSVRLHVMMGTTAAGLMMLWVAVLDGMGSYMLTPVSGRTTWGNVLNPTWGSLMLHRFVGELVMAGYVIAAYGAWRFGRQQDVAHREYYAVLINIGWFGGLCALALQAFTGLLYAVSINSADPAAYEQIVRGQYQGLAYLQFVLVGLLIVGNHFLSNAANPAAPRSRWLDVGIPVAAVFMVASVGHSGARRSFLYLLLALTLWSFRSAFQGRGKVISARQSLGAWGRPIAMTLGVLSVLIYVTMGMIRETARRPDTVRNMISLEDEAQHPAAFREAAGNGKSSISVRANRERHDYDAH
jgi:cytochrome bd-type quinol oxidase subunit 1